MARMPAPVTLRDVARLAGVHPGTVSRALNAATEALVNEETVRRVREAATELGYRPEPDGARAEDQPHVHGRRADPRPQNPLFPPMSAASTTGSARRATRR